MPKISVYLPDELYRRAREEGLKLSALTQEAVEQQLARDPNRRWLQRVTARPVRFTGDLDTERLLDGARDEFGT